MSRQGQFLTVPCRCTRKRENQGPDSRYARNENIDIGEYNVENSARSGNGCPEMSDELWNVLASLREKTCKYKSNYTEGNEFYDASPEFLDTYAPPYGGPNVLRKANELIDYVPESEFLRNMKQQCRLLQSNEPNIFSALDSVSDPNKCFDFDRPRTAENRYKSSMNEPYMKYNYSPEPLPLAKDTRLSYYPRGNENYPPEATGSVPCTCQHCQSQLGGGKKSEHVSRSKKRVQGGRRKRKSGSAGTVESEDRFQPTLKKPYENSCSRCWRYASPARSPVNKPDQRFDPNFRKAHSCATLEKMGEDDDYQDQKNSPCYRSKSIPSGSSEEKLFPRVSNVSSGRSSPRPASDNVRFSQPPNASSRAPDLQISIAKPVQNFPSSRPPSPRGVTNYVAGPPPKSAREASPRRYPAPSQPMQDPRQYYSQQKPRPDVSPRGPLQDYPPVQTRPKSVHECPEHSLPANYSTFVRPVQDASQYIQSRPVSSPARSERPSSTQGTIMQEYLPARCPMHPEVILPQSFVRQSLNQTAPAMMISEQYASTIRPPLETTYVQRPLSRTQPICPTHVTKAPQLEQVQRPKPQSFIPGPSSTNVNKCYVNVDQQNAASRGMYAPIEKDQCVQICGGMEPVEEDDLDVTVYKTYNPKPAATKDPQSRVGMMSPVPEDSREDDQSGSPGRGAGSRGGKGSPGREAGSRSGRGSPGRDGNSKSAKGSVDSSNAKSMKKAQVNSSQNLNKSPSSNRKKSPSGSSKKGKKKSPSPKSGSYKKGSGKPPGKGSSLKDSPENRICPPVPSSPKDDSKPCNPKSGSPKLCSSKQKSPTASPSKQKKPVTPLSPQPGPSGVQKVPQGERPQSANPPLSPQPGPSGVQRTPQGERPQTAGSFKQVDTSKSKLATALQQQVYDAGHLVIDCSCTPRVPYTDSVGELMCCHCHWDKKKTNDPNNPEDVLDAGTQNPKGFDGLKRACPYRKLAYRNLDSDIFEGMSDFTIMPPTPAHIPSRIEESSDLSHSRLLREVQECAERQKPAIPPGRKYMVFYMTQSREPKEDNVEVLVEELSKSCPDKTDERAKDLTEKMRKILDNPTDSMALRFQKGVAESRTPPSSRILYF